MPNNLPLNWCECKLEIVCALENGLKQNGLDLPLLDAKYLRGKKEAEYRQEGVVLNPEDYVILVDGENSGEIFSIYETGIMGSTFKKLSFSKFCSVPYVLFFIKSKQDLFRTNKKGAAIPHLDKTLFKNLVLPLPPLAEQERIVAKIEALFQDIDEGVERLKSAQAQIKQYRQSVLKSAFEGKLYKTTDWKEVDITKIIAKEKNALKAGPFGSALKKEIYVEKGYKIYGQEQVIAQNPFYGDYYINEEKYLELASCKVQPNDILISLVGTIGKVLILPNNIEKGIINPRLLKVTLDTSIYLPLFFKFYFESQYLRSLFKIKAHGATMDVLNLSILKELPFPLPTLPEQQRIVEEIEKRFAVANELEKAVNEGLEKADKLKQSILKKAFEGKLAPQNPNDEPASVLLERIKKSQLPTKGKKK